MIDKINSFVDAMIEERHQFDSIQNEINNCEMEVQAIIQRLENNHVELVRKSREKAGNADDSDMMAIFDKASGSLVTAISDANKKISEAIKGMTFIQDFEKHFTVAVFGKVKAGKSYIGNFVMGNAIKKNGVHTRYDEIEPITVHVYDRGNISKQDNLSEMPDDNDFKTGMQETTSTIQWFDLGGISWFDTPGIGSVTWENEMLAKEYVKNADLVIFACNSDAAGTRQEFAEMHKLYDMGKPILLLLTQSDMYDMDIDDEGEEISILVPKQEKDRKDTEEYMIQSLSEQGMSDLLKYDILTVSAKLGLEALKEGNEGMFEKSNMGLFLDKLIAITKNDAAEMKKSTPRKRLNEMIDGVVNDLEEMAYKMKEVCSSIEENRRDLEGKKDIILEQIKSRVYLEMLKIIQDYKVKVERDKVSVSETEISEKINLAISNCIKQVCTEEAIKSANLIKEVEIKLTGFGDMKMKQDSIAYEYISVISVERPPKGLFEKAGSRILKKKYYTSESRTEIRHSVFDIGVNDTEMAQSIMLKLDDEFRNSINTYIGTLVDGYYLPINEMQNMSNREIRNAINELQRLKTRC